MQKFYILVQKGEHVIRTYSLEKERVYIGRSIENDIILDDPLVSRTHCVLKMEQEKWTIQDANSKNGTFLNGKEIAQSDLIPGDEIRIGLYILKFLKTTPLADERTKEFQWEVKNPLLIEGKIDKKLIIQGIRAFLDEESSKREILKNQIYRDTLTGTYTRRFFEEEIKKYEAQKEFHPISIVFFDIDFFKYFNDTFGHKTGDLLLEGFGEFLIREIKQGFPVRWGGEEFVIFFLQKDKKEIFRKAICIKESFFILSKKKFGFPVSLSGGVSCFPEHGNTLKDVIEKADRCMYISKEKGRNTVTLFENENR